MEMKDFKYKDLDKYVFEDEDYILVISKDIFDEETVQYANEMIDKYQKEKEIILQHMLEKRLRKFYNNYSDEYIKRNIGRPKISIDFRKDKYHPNWKFKYAGIIDFIENRLDEHIISIEFIDDLQLDNSIQING